MKGKQKPKGVRMSVEIPPEINKILTEERDSSVVKVSKAQLIWRAVAEKYGVKVAS